ncbi:bifunctional 3,4-dihydroxy-2-butanone-4-phosphate synthase/GTP cyclohydrolase II [Companilactobacillus ginsenosidimutans]|uniref:Multifunctional fusion protein n=1 Tax=Companilactobacillus ginsenosidimutans TaxID=1007676 RepID=A0A0H4QMD8_9LACO|nr:bifunctional 3,4-dihydroxy-2-butanone-4-phosphate synthase/GTP cyclohydrolase II [Companilactobacillus ginsenosidimutans]AKP67863.1 3,4-dihydroxy-2-butanone 4-phosphate synthase [Companilactobacillus ginsenosidimutans]
MTSTEIIEKVENALTELKKGNLIIVADSPDRESEGDMIGLADFATGENVNTMIKHARGLLCVPMSPEYAQRLKLKPMVPDGEDAYGTAFTISTDAKTTTTGISAFDRAKTINALADPSSSYDDFYHPGHIFPLVAAGNGIFERTGHTEAAVDLAKLAGGSPVAYICECVKESGTMARLKDLRVIAEKNNLELITIEDIIEYRRMKDTSYIEEIADVNLPSKYGDFKMKAFKVNETDEPTLLIYNGEINGADPLLFRMHSECLTGDILGSKRCDCGQQLETALRAIEKNGSGAVLYLRQEGRGIGLANKLKAYELQEQGYDTVEANIKLGFKPDEREYGLAASILKMENIDHVQLMTNNPDKIEKLEQLGIKVDRRIPIETKPIKENIRYLETKKIKFHHLLSEVN